MTDLARLSRALRRRVICIVSVLLATTCSGFADNVLRVGVQLEPPNLDPTSGAAAAIDEVVYANLFEGLTGISHTGEVVPRLAAAWQVSADGRQLRFDLLDGVRFHDGTTFDAEDVVFTFRRLLGDQSTNAQKSLFTIIADVRAIDRLTVEFELTRPAADFPRYLAWGDAVIVAPESAAQNASHPIGTGPFRFLRWRKGVSVELERFADFRDQSLSPTTNLDGIRFVIIPDPAAAYAAMMAGEIDGFPNYPAPENLAQLARVGQFRVVTGTGEGETLLALNHAHPALSDLRVRQALSMAIDRQAIIDGAMFGIGQAIGSHFPPHHPDYVDLSGRYPFDPARARSLLRAAGFDAGLKLSLKVPPPSYARRSAELIVAQLADVGVELDVENMEWAQWLTEVFTNKQFDLSIVAHTEPLDYDIYARDDYYFQYQNEVYSALIDEINTTPEGERRSALIVRAQQHLSDDAANVFLFQAPKTAVWRNGVEGVWQNAPLQANDFTLVFREGPGSGQEATAKAGARIAAGIVLAVALLGLCYLVARVGLRYFFRRVIALLVTLFVASLVIFTLVEIAPGDPATYMMGLNAEPEALAALREELGLEGSAPRRYVSWVGNMATGDFGTSYTYRSSVADILWDRLSVSLPLALLAISIALLLAVPAGVVAARYRGSTVDRLTRFVSQIGIAIPNFWAATLLVMVFGITLGWLPVGGFPGWDAGLLPALRSLFLPAVALALPQAAILCRVSRTALVDTMGDDYIRTARSKGLSEWQVVRRHALRNAAIPVLTLLGLQISFLLAGGIIIENVFYLPGLGRLVFQAIAQRDLIVVEGVVMLLVLATVLVAFAVDLTYAAIDPRLRGQS